MNNNNRLFVAGLPFSSTEDEIKNLFQTVGNVISVSIILDRITNKSKGFGFVEMEKADDAKKAIEKLNDTDFGGRKLVVAIAKPQEKRDFKPRFGGGDRRPSFGGPRKFGRDSGGSRGGFSRGNSRNRRSSHDK